VQHLVAITILLYCHDMYFLLPPQFAEKFYADPKKYALKLQLWILNQRYLTYVAAMEHIANTGERLCTCHILGECRTLWGERCMHFRHRREPKLLSVSEVTILVVVAHCWHQFSWAYNIDYHVTSLPGLVLLLFGLSSACLIPSQGHSLLTHSMCH